MKKAKEFITGYLQAFKTAAMRLLTPINKLTNEECLMRNIFINICMIFVIMLIACVGAAAFLKIWEPLLLVFGMVFLIIGYISYTEMEFQRGRFRFIRAVCENRSAATGLFNRNSIIFHFTGFNADNTTITFYLTRQNMSEFVIGQEYLLCFNGERYAPIDNSSYIGRIMLQSQGQNSSMPIKETETPIIEIPTEDNIDTDILDEALQMGDLPEPENQSEPAEQSENVLRFEIVNGRPTILPNNPKGEM